VNFLLKELQTDRELLSSRNKEGYILNVDSWNKVIKLHLTSCRYCNPHEEGGIQVESKIMNKTGETWYSDQKEEVEAKATEMVRKKGYSYSSCDVCKPYL